MVHIPKYSCVSQNYLKTNKTKNLQYVVLQCNNALEIPQQGSSLNDCPMTLKPVNLLLLAIQSLNCSCKNSYTVYHPDI